MPRLVKPRIAVAGLGFVGLTTSLGFAEKGFAVCGFDPATERVNTLREGRVDFHEPHLGNALKKHLGRGFTLGTSLGEAVVAADAVFFCVGTPIGPGGAADLKYLRRAVRDAAAAVKPGKFRIFVIKSTVPPGTAEAKLAPLLREAGLVSGKDVGLMSNPEFLREGCAWDDFMRPDRIVIGADHRATFALAERLYKGFGAPIVRVNLTTAEFVKCVSNTFLATLISFANECSIVADSIGGIDLRGAFAALHQDRRWFGEPARMSTYFFPGCGFGGYCLPKDASAFAAVARAHGFEAKMTAAAIRVNHDIQCHFVKKILAASKRGGRIGILGLAFKPGTDDVRDSPALSIIKQLLEAGRKIMAFDPIANEAFGRAYGLPIEYATSMTELVQHTDPVALLVGWPEFQRRKRILAKKTVIDGRYIL